MTNVPTGSKQIRMYMQKMSGKRAINQPDTSRVLIPCRLDCLAKTSIGIGLRTERSGGFRSESTDGHVVHGRKRRQRVVCV